MIDRLPCTKYWRQYFFFLLNVNHLHAISSPILYPFAIMLLTLLVLALSAALLALFFLLARRRLHLRPPLLPLRNQLPAAIDALDLDGNSHFANVAPLSFQVIIYYWPVDSPKVPHRYEDRLASALLACCGWRGWPPSSFKPAIVHSSKKGRIPKITIPKNNTKNNIINNVMNDYVELRSTADLGVIHHLMQNVTGSPEGLHFHLPLKKWYRLRLSFEL